MNNAAAYSAQVLLIIAMGALLASAFRLQMPKARLWFWQALLALCLLLPVLQPRQASPISSTVEEGPIQAGTPVKMSPARAIPITEALVGIYAMGVVARFIWLLLGCWRLRLYRRNAVDFSPVDGVMLAAKERLATFPDVRLSSEITGPVTFGLFDPVVLLPPSFLDLDQGSREAIMVHELMHVRRGDWAFSISEEIVRSILWFHPGIWWLLAQIQLAREQVVDRAVIEFTRSREQYLEALLAVAKTKVRPDLALAPLFLKQRHLAKRVAAVMKEVRMSKRQMASSLATVFTLALITARVAVFMFPLESSAQEVHWDQSIGVTVDPQGQKLLHGSRVEYPRQALEKNIEGTVVLQLNLNAKGEVSDARVVSGPEELRRAALSSALKWHFENEAAQPTTIQASISFKTPPSAGLGSPRHHSPQVSGPSVLRRIEYTNVPETIREALQRRLPVREGDTVTADLWDRVAPELHAVDEHLRFGYRVDLKDGSGVLHISLGDTPEASPAIPFNPPPTEGVKRLRIGGNAQSAKIVHKVTPSYPVLAKQTRVQGTVRYNVLIGADGSIRVMDLVSGHPLLVEAATPAVQQWRYRPTLLNGNPVEVTTMIDVNFTLLD